MMPKTGLLVPVHYEQGHWLTDDVYAVCLGSDEGHAHGWTTSATAAVSLAMDVGTPFVNVLSVDLTRGGEVLAAVLEVKS